MKKLTLLTILLIALAASPVMASGQALSSSGVPASMNLIATPTPVQKTIKFGPALEYPRDIDQLYLWIETGYNLYTWTDCLPGQLQKPYITWGMVRDGMKHLTDDKGASMVIIPAQEVVRIIGPGGGKFPNSGTVKISENDLYSLIITAVFGNPGTLSCSTSGDGKPTVYGPGVQWALDWLAKNRLYR